MWPTENDYTKAVTRVNPSPFSLLNTKKIQVILDENDQPVKRVGNNAVIFKVCMNEKFYALKCYTKEINNQTNYLQAVEKYVAQISSTFMLPFELFESEVYVIKSENSFHGTYCVLLMPWIEGKTLYNFVQRCCEEKNRTALDEIFTQFQQMSVWLLQQTFVHGNLAAENIMVTPQGKLMLADYDNILFDELTDTTGQSPYNNDFQHPKRNQHVINLAADQFSILVLAISLKALQFKPELFSTYTNESGLIFTANSLREGDKSAVYKELKNINDFYLQNLLRLFVISINKQTIEIPLLSTCIVDFDSQSYNRLLEIEVEELKKDLENSSSQIQILQSEVSKEIMTKEKLFAENKKLKEAIIEIETKKKNKAALKRNISLSLAGLTSIAVVAGFLFYTPAKEKNNIIIVANNVHPKILPAVVTPATIKKDSVVTTSANAPVINPTSTAAIIPQVKKENSIPEKIQKQKLKPVIIKKDVAPNNLVITDNIIAEKNYVSSASFKPRKAKAEKTGTDYKLFRSGGF